MKPNISWKDKRIEAINKLSKKKGWNSSDTNPYFEEIHAIYESDAKTLLDFKKEKLLKKVYSL
jgi:translation initiation factor IF-2